VVLAEGPSSRLPPCSFPVSLRPGGRCPARLPPTTRLTGVPPCIPATLLWKLTQNKIVLSPRRTQSLLHSPWPVAAASGEGPSAHRWCTAYP